MDSVSPEVWSVVVSGMGPLGVQWYENGSWSGIPAGTPDQLEAVTRHSLGDGLSLDAVGGEHRAAMSQINREWAISKLRGYIEATSNTYVPDGPNTIGFWTYKLDKPKLGSRLLHRLSRRSSTALSLGGGQLSGRNRSGSRSGVNARPHIGPWPSWRRSRSPRTQPRLRRTAIGRFELHPWVWGSVQVLWGSGHYRQAVGVTVQTHREYRESYRPDCDTLTASHATW